MPFAFVDLDLLDENIKQVLTRAKKKKVRVASKSVRSVDLLKRILASNSKFQGIMCFTVLEAIFLSNQGFDDILIAYPCCQERLIMDVCKEVRKGKTIVLMIDSMEHVEMLQSIAKKCNVVLHLCMDIDLSSDFLGLHFGVWRSSIFNKEQALKIFDKIQESKNLKLSGVMGYEAQIAGVGDNYPGQLLKNAVVRVLKKRSIREIINRRKEIVMTLKSKGAELRFVNGGGTGSLESTTEEDVLTEVTVGSGFYASALFDNYSNFRHLPAAGFAIEIVRKPKPHIYTCHGGGYVASGSVSADKLPQPYLPRDMRLTKNEGAGEVQTPLIYLGEEQLSLGDPVFMRHSKAGELCERFNKLLLVSGGQIVGEVNTYRGEGKCFL